MKKSIIIIGCIIAIVAILVLVIKPLGEKPFKNLSDDKISEVTVKFMPPNKTISLTDDDVVRLVKILNSCVVYAKDDSYIDYNGQTVLYTITKKDGTVTEVAAFNPFLIINGVGYKTKYNPCERLSVLGNKILDAYNP